MNTRKYQTVSNTMTHVALFFYDFDSVFTLAKSETETKTFTVDFSGGLQTHSSSLTSIVTFLFQTHTSVKTP